MGGVVVCNKFVSGLFSFLDRLVAKGDNQEALLIFFFSVLIKHRD